jgi:hypothetical protein
MAGLGAGTLSTAVMGGFLCIGLFLLAIAATVILSLIPTFTSNNSQQPSGEEYRCDAMMLKMLYTNLTSNFSDSVIGSSESLNTYCTQQLLNQNIPNVAGCVLINGYAWGPYNTSTNSRRRRDVTVGLYAVFEGRVFFSNCCCKKSDENQYQSSNTISNCVYQRLGYANSLVNNNGYSTSFNQWTPTPTFSISIVDSTLAAYHSVSPSQVYGVPSSKAISIGSTLGLSNTVEAQLNSGCRYIGPISLANINSIIATQASQATTLPTGGR